MTVTHIAPPFLPLVEPMVYGGVERVVLSLIRTQARLGVRTEVIAPSDSRVDGLLPTVASIGVSDLYSPVVAKEDVRHHTYARLEHVAKALGYLGTRSDRVVHVHDDQLLPFLGGLRVPYVVTVHCDWEEFWDADRHPDLAGRNWNLVALSESHRRRFAARGFPMLDVVYNGIDVEEFPCSDRKDDYLLSLSVIAPHKGQATAVEVARAAGQNLVLAGNVGDPDYFARVAPSITHDASGAVDKLAAYRALPGAHRAIVYVGPVDDVQKKPLFAHARALLMPFTMEEPCPLVALEALACGTPVIALDRGPASELVRHGETGYVCRSATEMVEAVRALDRLTSRACRADAEQRFSADAMARAYGRLYERVARERSATRDI